MRRTAVTAVTIYVMISAVEAGLSHIEEHVSSPRINPLYWRLRDTLIVRHTVEEKILAGDSTARDDGVA